MGLEDGDGERGHALFMYDTYSMFSKHSRTREMTRGSAAEMAHFLCDRDS